MSLVYLFQPILLNNTIKATSEVLYFNRATKVGSLAFTKLLYVYLYKKNGFKVHFEHLPRKRSNTNGWNILGNLWQLPGTMLRVVFACVGAADEEQCVYSLHRSVQGVLWTVEVPTIFRVKVFSYLL